MINDFIPRIEKMLEKEKKHCEMLRSYCRSNKTGNLTAIRFLMDSAFAVEHYEERLQEYKDYVK